MPKKTKTVDGRTIVTGKINEDFRRTNRHPLSILPCLLNDDNWSELFLGDAVCMKATHNKATYYFLREEQKMAPGAAIFMPRYTLITPKSLASKAIKALKRSKRAIVSTDKDGNETDIREYLDIEPYKPSFNADYFLQALNAASRSRTPREYFAFCSQYMSRLSDSHKVNQAPIIISSLQQAESKNLTDLVKAVSLAAKRHSYHQIVNLMLGIAENCTREEFIALIQRETPAEDGQSTASLLQLMQEMALRVEDTYDHKSEFLHLAAYIGDETCIENVFKNRSHKISRTAAQQALTPLGYSAGGRGNGSSHTHAKDLSESNAASASTDEVVVVGEAVASFTQRQRVSPNLRCRRPLGQAEAAPATGNTALQLAIIHGAPTAAIEILAAQTRHLTAMNTDHETAWQLAYKAKCTDTMECLAAYPSVYKSQQKLGETGRAEIVLQLRNISRQPLPVAVSVLEPTDTSAATSTAVSGDATVDSIPVVATALPQLDFAEPTGALDGMSRGDQERERVLQALESQLNTDIYSKNNPAARREIAECMKRVVLANNHGEIDAILMRYRGQRIGGRSVLRSTFSESVRPLGFMLNDTLSGTHAKTSRAIRQAATGASDVAQFSARATTHWFTRTLRSVGKVFKGRRRTATATATAAAGNQHAGGGGNEPAVKKWESNDDDHDMVMAKPLVQRGAVPAQSAVTTVIGQPVYETAAAAALRQHERSVSPSSVSAMVQQGTFAQRRATVDATPVDDEATAKATAELGSHTL